MLDTSATDGRDISESYGPGGFLSECFMSHSNAAANCNELTSRHSTPLQCCMVGIVSHEDALLKNAACWVEKRFENLQKSF